METFRKKGNRQERLNQSGKRFCKSPVRRSLQEREKSEGQDERKASGEKESSGKEKSEERVKMKERPQVKRSL